MAEAAARAFSLTGQERWARVVESAASWFEGDNDVGVPVGDPLSGAGFDGLTPTGVNANQGAESTLAYVAVMTRRRRLRHARVPRARTPEHPSPIKETP